MSHSSRLRSKIRLARSGLDRVAEALWSHPDLNSIYPEFLYRNHAIIRSSVSLMRAAADASETRFGADPVTPGLMTYLRKHIPEETGHDEWVLDDLAVLGRTKSEVLARIPPLSASALVGPQYYWIFHVHPIALLGYIAVLEGTPPDADYFRAVLTRAGIPESAASNIFLHAKLDPTHRDDLDAVLDSLPLTEYHHSLMGISAFQTLWGLTHVVDEILAGADERGKASAGAP